jgi:hypothetical protein
MRFRFLHNFISTYLPLEFIRAMTTPVLAAITATREVTRREDHRPTFQIKILAFDERPLFRFDSHTLSRGAS